MKTKTINIDIFDTPIHIYIWEKWLFEKYYYTVFPKAVEYPNDDNCDWITCNTIEFTDVVVGVFDWDLWTLIHEVNHAIQIMLDKRNIPMGVDNTELVSNLWEYILPKALDLLNKYDKNQLSKLLRNGNKEKKKVLPKSKQLS